MRVIGRLIWYILAMQRISFLSKGQKINGTLVLPDERDGLIPAVLFFHGMTSSEKRYIPYAQALAKEGIAGLALSLRAHGDSEGEFDKLTVRDMVIDGLTAYDFLVSQPNIDPERIGICGTSVGAVIASLVAKDRRVKSIVLRVPATYSEAMMEKTFAQMMEGEERVFHNLEEVDNTPAIQAISDYTGSLLVVSSELDDVIPKKIPETYYTLAKKAKQRQIIEMKGATHGLEDEELRKQFSELIVKWFSKVL